ncbi:AAA family ATPase [Limosilactobacillus reuteri]|uniref:ATP-binding protein n=1 Tax=Limosilactobacillus reuteri TaxID=1598 RepID=UPI001E48F8AD|nr:AAA family ATPase [Limosilactobacillus reuteri]MCC4436386.1 AAA family ATPase [Limosilactobacillus reuteri]MCC4437368.1 AAA family ATPase [Limosilactobacillus reuteri]MCC4442323.1 AAA family ATPase [Limosilactobacillus reuteri]MCC4444503.1 AAA family ATPase [Limosilactobacillus reuteri]MCC4446429.1 AAA family ATPase [Limosilactobacillus reuteri]
MKIKKAHIDGFGKWHDQDFDFTANPQIIYGPNEAGKTTLMAFLVSILFGFADGRGKNRFAQYIPKTTFSYGGSLLVEINGHDYVIKRERGRNGGKVSVTDSQGRQGGEQELKQLLGPMDRSLYQALFSFGQRDLTAVDELNRDEWQQHLQQLGAVGSAQWDQLINQYQKQADHLYKPRGRKWPLNQDLHQYANLTDKINQAHGKFHRYQDLQADLKTNKEKLRQAQAELQKQQPLLQKLEHLQQLWSVYHEWQSSHQTRPLADYLTDQQVTTAQELQVREKELRRQQQVYQQRLARIDHQSPQAPKHSPQSMPELQRLKEQVVELQAEEALQHRQQTQANQWQQELTAIKTRYHHPLPAPLTSQEKAELARLLNIQPLSRANTNQSNGDLSRAAMIGIVGGFVLFIIGLLANATFITAIGAMAAFATVMYLYYQRQGSHPAPVTTDSQAIMAFGQKHGLQNFPPDQWLLMQGDLQRNAELVAQLQTAKQDQQRYDHQLAIFNQQLPPALQNLTLTAVRTKLDNLLEQGQQARQDIQANTREKATIANNLAQLNQDYSKIHQQKMAIYQQAGVHDDNQFTQYLASRSAAQSQALASDAYGQQLTAEDRQALAAYANKDELMTALAKTRHQLDQLNLTISHTHEKIQKDKVEIDSLVEDGTLSNLEQERANLAAKIWREVQEWLRYQLAIQWINRALVGASADRYPAIIRQAEQYFALLTDHRYSQIDLTADGIKVVRRDQEVFLVEELSQGTAEQLYIALRLGFVTVMSDQANFPVIIDDGFVNFDNVRRQRMLALLEKIAEKNQVIYFTADDRIKDLDVKILDLQALKRE